MNAAPALMDDIPIAGQGNQTPFPMLSRLVNEAIAMLVPGLTAARAKAWNGCQCLDGIQGPQVYPFIDSSLPSSQTLSG